MPPPQDVHGFGQYFEKQAKVAGLVDLLDDNERVLINNGALPEEQIESVDDIQLRVSAIAGVQIGQDAVRQLWRRVLAEHDGPHLLHRWQAAALISAERRQLCAVG